MEETVVEKKVNLPGAYWRLIAELRDFPCELRLASKPQSVSREGWVRRKSQDTLRSSCVCSIITLWRILRALRSDDQLGPFPIRNSVSYWTPSSFLYKEIEQKKERNWKLKHTNFLIRSSMTMKSLIEIPRLSIQVYT